VSRLQAARDRTAREQAFNEEQRRRAAQSQQAVVDAYRCDLLSCICLRNLDTCNRRALVRAGACPAGVWLRPIRAALRRRARRKEILRVRREREALELRQQLEYAAHLKAMQSRINAERRQRREADARQERERQARLVCPFDQSRMPRSEILSVCLSVCLPWRSCARNANRHAKAAAERSKARSGLLGSLTLLGNRTGS
jgi:hypothetical protein